MILPEMGTAETWSKGGGLASALFTPVQQRVLGLLFGQPQRRFQSAELIRLAGSGTGAVHRQLQRLASTGLVAVTREGNQKYLKREPPARAELEGLIRSGATRLVDAQNEDISAEGCFDLAYNPAHALALAALRAKGYRADKLYADPEGAGAEAGDDCVGGTPSI
jgi:hypothetical protein